MVSLNAPWYLLKVDHPIGGVRARPFSSADASPANARQASRFRAIQDERSGGWNEIQFCKLDYRVFTFTVTQATCVNRYVTSLPSALAHLLWWRTPRPLMVRRPPPGVRVGVDLACVRRTAAHLARVPSQLQHTGSTSDALLSRRMCRYMR